MSADAEQLARLQSDVDALLAQLADAELRWQPWTDPVADENRCSATNLVHYWAMRQVDLRDAQQQLTALGLSSLGRSEAHVQATLRLVSAALAAMRGQGWTPNDQVCVEVAEGGRLLERNATELLGPAAEDRAARIMVTLPSEAATNPGLSRTLIDSGMRIARINCAHDDAAAWKAMADNVRAAAAAAGQTCLVAMDLGGPKLRTGPLEPGPRVVRLRPTRNAQGQVVAAGRGWLTSARRPARPPEPDLAILPVKADWLANRAEGDELVLRDTRGSKRRLLLAAAAPGGFVVTTEKTTYVGTGTVLKAGGQERSDSGKKRRRKDSTKVGEVPAVEQSLRLAAGDVVRVTRDCTPAPVDEGQPPRIGCTLPELFDTAEVGERVFFDDGKLGGVVVAVTADALDVRIERPAHGTAKLRAGKGINVPDTDLPISALTDKDIADLATVVELADFVELSFVREPADVIRLFDELDRLGDRDLGVVLKIETRLAFEHLPRLLLTAMRRRRVGVMIARGDLAVEVGYERMAELQEETLCLCEAAHLPVIWATQVLEQLATTGLPSRAEITDAAMAERAECVMLNKGPYITDAVVTLDDVLGRMAGHEHKKSSLLRSLQSWRATD
ncbi:pyruvate kinase [Mycolicibacterium aromaticivorans JS19b1 = JCM 16368]|uniref:pyruvate kinase n=1 Tax=Mycolicibacterium aromaticivorans JS19b1 = JCM 16368 TaxID=1440774 RepID=A0A064CQB0_9MYCO|nr:pyruvate kinase [Mycolicibacterium aromaticivorans]KDF01827.1 pyruvate kinase [Mycolicibacterium aromaticivorans JS19b1 = JCM 16368]